MILLEHGKYYHIYNRGVNRCNLFYERKNYYHFLRLYDRYISPIAETYAWVLLKNHFHLLVRIKEEGEINLAELPIPLSADPEVYQASLKKIHLYFSDLFNSYSQAINKQEGRTGSLFQRPFRRIHVDNPAYFNQLVIYIHTNPVHHGLMKDFKDYPWSSYGKILSLNSGIPERDKVIGWFNDKGEFINQHQIISSTVLFENYIIE